MEHALKIFVFNIDDKTITFKLQNKPVMQVCKNKFFGLTISDDLCWKERMHMVKQKLRAAMSCVYHSRSYH